jgi:hypothetical protein
MSKSKSELAKLTDSQLEQAAKEHLADVHHPRRPGTEEPFAGLDNERRCRL